MAARIPLIAGNWKMNKTCSEAVELVKKLKMLVKDADAKEREIVVCPAFTALNDIARELKGTKMSLGAQNLHFEELVDEIEDSQKLLYHVSAKFLKGLGIPSVEDLPDYQKLSNFE